MILTLFSGQSICALADTGFTFARYYRQNACGMLLLATKKACLLLGIGDGFKNYFSISRLLEPHALTDVTQVCQNGASKLALTGEASFACANSCLNLPERMVYTYFLNAI
jgi:hypothetical protein